MRYKYFLLFIFLPVFLYAQPGIEWKFNNWKNRIETQLRSDISDSLDNFQLDFSTAYLYNISDYGVDINDADSASSNATILNALVDSCYLRGEKGVIYIPQGTVYYDSCITLDRKNITIIGANDSTSVLKYTGSGNALFIDGAVGATAGHNTINNLHIVGTDSANSILKLDYGGNNHFTNLRLDSATYAIWSSGPTWSNTFNKVWGYGSTYGLYVNTTFNANIFINCIFYYCTYGAYVRGNATRVLDFYNCQFEYNDLNAYIENGYAIKFENCWFEELEDDTSSIDLGKSGTSNLENVIVSNCSFLDGKWGIRLKGQVKGFVAQNNIIKALSYGLVNVMYNAWASDVKVSGTNQQDSGSQQAVKLTDTGGYASTYTYDNFSMNEDYLIDMSDGTYLWDGDYGGFRTKVWVNDDTIQTEGVLKPQQFTLSLYDSSATAPMFYNSWVRGDTLYLELENGNYYSLGYYRGNTLDTSSIADKIVAFYALDDDGTWADDVGDLDLTEQGTVSCEFGVVDSCGFFAGSADWLYYVDHDTFSFADDTTMGLFCWVKIADQVSCGIVCKDSGEVAGKKDWGLGYSVALGPAFYFYRGNNAVNTDIDTCSSAISASTQKWYLIFCWQDTIGTDQLFMRIYDQPNGLQCYDSVDCSGTYYDSDAPFQIGSRIGADFEGLIDEVGILNAVPTTTEMDHVWREGRGRAYPYMIRP